MRLPLAAVLLGVLLLGRGLANESGQAGGIPLEQLYPGPLGMAQFGKIVAGEFTGDLKLDAVVMDGQQPKLLVAPETFDSAILVCPSANDIAVLKGALSDPDKDCLLTVSTAGLVRYERLSASASWAIVTIRGTSTDWNGARKVAVGQVDGGGPLDIVGIAANGRSVLIEYGNADGSYTPGPRFMAYGSTVTDLWLLNWREGALPNACEIALCSPGGLEVRSRTGVLFDVMEWSLAPILGAVVTDAGTPLQRLALVTEVEGSDRLLVFGDTLTEPNVQLGTAGVVALASGDADGDGDTELFLGLDSEKKFWMLENQGPGSPTFDPSQVTKFPFGPSGRNPAYNHAGLAPGDFDSDGKLDVLAPAQGDPGPAVAVCGSVALVNVESQVVGGWKASINKVTYITSTNQLEFRFTRPQAILSPPAGAQNTLGIKVYRTPTLGAGTLGAPYLSTFIALPPSNGYTPLYLQMPSGFSLQTSNDLFSFVVRQTTRVTSSGAVLDIAPAMTAIFTAEPGVNTIYQIPKTLLIETVTTDPSSSPTFAGVDIGPTVPSMGGDVEPEDFDP